jgi:hypothetical protein
MIFTAGAASKCAHFISCKKGVSAGTGAASFFLPEAGTLPLPLIANLPMFY